jgi:hypothetical protein
MKLSEVKEALQGMSEVVFQLEDGTRVPEHFHVTEVGSVNRHFIDCGGTVSKESAVNFQLWTADDHDHRLATTKLLNIIRLSEEKLGLTDAEVEVEFETTTTGIYHLALRNNAFVLVPKHTDCRAKDACGIPETKQKVSLSEVGRQACCTPGGGCC